MTNRGIFKKRGVVLNPEQREKSQWVLGQQGTGKSMGLATWALADIKAGQGMSLFDPHQDLYRLLLKHTALLADDNPVLAERVVLIDPHHPVWVPGINPLQNRGDFDPVDVAVFFKEIVMKIWGLDSTQAPRMSWLLVNTLTALVELGLTIVELPVFLRDHEWRNRVVVHLENTDIRDYFLREFPTNERLRQEWMQSTLNKLGQFVLNKDIKLLLGQREGLDFRKLLDNRNVILINLPAGLIGMENAQLLGGLIQGIEQRAALSRADVHRDERPAHYIYLDEWHLFTTDHVKDVLSQSRKYGLSLVLANQFIGQIPPILQEAIMNLSGTIVCFRIGYEDAQTIVKEVFPPDPSSRNRTNWQLHRLGRLPLMLPHRERSGRGFDWEGATHKLTTLNAREFYVKQRGPGMPVKQRTSGHGRPLLSADEVRGTYYPGGDSLCPAEGGGAA